MTRYAQLNRGNAIAERIPGIVKDFTALPSEREWLEIKESWNESSD